MSSAAAVSRSARRHVLLGVTLCAILAFTASQTASAGNGFVIGHAGSPLARAGQDLTLSALVHSTCTIGSCSDIRFVVVYQVPEGSRFQFVMLPAQKTQIGAVTIPGQDVRSPWISYRLAAYQTRCLWHCSISSSETMTYTVAVRGG